MVNYRGFSLIELIITIAIIGIMATIGANTFQEYTAKTNLRAAAREISSDFANYRERARSEGRVYTITFNSAPTNNYSISAPASGTLGAFNLIKSPSAVAAGIELSGDANFTGCTVVRITQRGLLEHCSVTPSPQNNQGTVSLRNSRGSTATVTVTSTVKTYVTFP